MRLNGNTEYRCSECVVRKLKRKTGIILGCTIGCAVGITTGIQGLAYAHGGGTDAYGGHIHGKTGIYHCHKDPCKTELATLDAIEEKRAFSFVYRRQDWKHWSDLDNDCMNTRHEILKDQSVGKVKLSPNGCHVSSGKWVDPFSGKTFYRASDLDVDHVVPLKWANNHGGSNLNRVLKEKFANDPANLLAVDDGLNQAKGAKGPTEWMPPNQAFRCQYLGIWQSILAAYPMLKMTPSETRIFRKQLEACDLNS